ncbi:MAG: hypothetical protein RLZZ126_957 [Pseudomonadota bacterium]
MIRLRAFWRLLGVVAHLLFGLAQMLFMFRSWSEQQRRQAVCIWARGLLRRFGVTCEWRGMPPLNGPLLVVCNHRSWMDILVLHAHFFGRFIAKAELRSWPVLGYMADLAGTLFIERGARRDTLRVVHHMAAALNAGDVLIIFPEGTTSSGPDPLPFHANLFQAAVSARSPVLPVGLLYLEAGTGTLSHAPDFVGDTPGLTSVWRTLCAPPLRAVLRMGQPESVPGSDRRQLAERAHIQVARLLQRPLQ